MQVEKLFLFLKENNIDVDEMECNENYAFFKKEEDEEDFYYDNTKVDLKYYKSVDNKKGYDREAGENKYDLTLYLPSILNNQKYDKYILSNSYFDFVFEEYLNFEKNEIEKNCKNKENEKKKNISLIKKIFNIFEDNKENIYADKSKVKKDLLNRVIREINSSDCLCYIRKDKLENFIKYLQNNELSIINELSCGLSKKQSIENNNIFLEVCINEIKNEDNQIKRFELFSKVKEKFDELNDVNLINRFDYLLKKYDLFQDTISYFVEQNQSDLLIKTNFNCGLFNRVYFFQEKQMYMFEILKEILKEKNINANVENKDGYYNIYKEHKIRIKDNSDETTLMIKKIMCEIEKFYDSPERNEIFEKNQKKYSEYFTYKEDEIKEKKSNIKDIKEEVLKKIENNNIIEVKKINIK